VLNYTQTFKFTAFFATREQGVAKRGAVYARVFAFVVFPWLLFELSHLVFAAWTFAFLARSLIRGHGVSILCMCVGEMEDIVGFPIYWVGF